VEYNVLAVTTLNNLMGILKGHPAPSLGKCLSTVQNITQTEYRRSTDDIQTGT